jgi:hypothetical protein
MTTSAPSARLSQLVESSASRLTVLLGALRTLQVPDPRLSPVVLNGILNSAIRQATELERLIEDALAESKATNGTT